MFSLLLNPSDLDSYLSEGGAVLTNTMAWVLGAFAVFSFVALQFIVAPYGKFRKKTPTYWLGKRLGWFIAEVPSLVVAVYVTWVYVRHRTTYQHHDDVTSHHHHTDRVHQPQEEEELWVKLALLAMFVVHYAQRSLVYPFLQRGNNAGSVAACLFACSFCTYNGCLQAVDVMYAARYPPTYCTHPQFVIGYLLFLVGLMVNLHSDHVLRTLRKPGGDEGYYIPHGGFFRWVTAANYTGETLEWLGFSVAVGRLPALMFFLFTVSNLMPRAKHYHRWYLAKFKETYPRNRKAYIPFIY